MKKLFLIAKLLFFAIVVVNADKTIYVAPTASGTGSGVDASNPCRLGDAIRTKYDATAGAITTIVFPANTTFTLDNTDGTANASRFDFPATSNKFIFEGNNSTLNNGSNGSNRIFRISGSTANIEIKNLNFLNGKLLSSVGGAIYFAGDVLKISGCTFNNCGNDNGGAIASRGKNLEIQNSYFLNNYLTANASTRGAAITHTGTSAGGTLLVENTTFSNNSGKAGYACYGTAICTAKDGTAANYLSSIKINNCTFYKNSNGYNTTAGSAAVYLDDTSGTNTSNVAIINNTFYANNNAAINIIGTKQTVTLVNNVIVGDAWATISVTGYNDYGVIASSSIGAGRPSINGKNNYIVEKTPLGINITESSFQSGSNGNTFITTTAQSVIDAVYLNSTLSTTSVPYLTITNSSSPLVNTGTSSVIGITIPTADIRGIARGTGATGSGYDIGAFELSKLTVNTDGNISDSGLSDTELAGTEITLSGGEFTIDASKRVNIIKVLPGAKLTLNSGSVLNSGKINLESNADGTATFVDKNTGASSVTGNVQQYLPTARNWYMTPPISTSTVPTGSTYFGYQEDGTNADLSVNGSTEYWKPYIQGAALIAGKGYIVQPTGEVTFSFDGTLNTGDITIQLSRTSQAAKPGFNLVGNPYPSYLDWSLVAAANTNVMSTAWFRTKKTVAAGGGYTFSTVNVENVTPIVVSNDANTTITNLIPPMQAYWVRLNNNPSTTNYTVNNAMRAHIDDSGNKFKAPKQDDLKLIRLRVSDGTNSDETVLYFSENASDAFDRYDSPKMGNNSASIPEIYTQVDNEKLVINGMSALSDETEVPLGFAIGQKSHLTLTANELKNLDMGTRVVLLDRLAHTETELGAGVIYSFDAEVTSSTTGRFSLMFRTPGTTTGLDNIGKLDIRVFVNSSNKITIDAPVNSTYEVYNALGMLIIEGKTKVNYTEIEGIMSNSIYVVKVSHNSRKYISKIAIK